MFTISRAVPVNNPNDPDQPMLTRSMVWHGLQLKAENALPFVRAISECEVLRRGGQSLVREVVVKGERLQERVTLYPERLVIFERLSGRAAGHILNEIEQDDDGQLYLRFSFTFEIEGLPNGSSEERAFMQSMEQDYLGAVATTLNAVRQMAKEGHFAEATTA
ncbi:MAG TPA: SRPBCC family protein [Roseiflexaceae bacterium]|nr:SRPBCC family protein [Roseiflexaceae bacterium]